MPIPLSLLKSHLRVDFADDDAILALYLDAATAWMEGATRRLLSQQSRSIRMLGFEDVMLPFPPIDSVGSVTYKDANGATQTLSASKYLLDTTEAMTYLRFLDDLPSVHEDSFDRVTVNFTCGWSTPPQDVVVAVLQLAAGSYLMRESVATPAAPRFAVDFGVESVAARWAVPEFLGRLDP